MAFINFNEIRKASPGSWTAANGSTWRYYDAVAAAGNRGAYEGMLVLREDRPGCEEPKYHWRDLVPKYELQQVREEA